MTLRRLPEPFARWFAQGGSPIPAIYQYFQDVDQRLRTVSGGPVATRSYEIASLPSAANHEGALIYVSDEAGGAVIAFSDGTNWRRVQDRMIVS